MALTMSDFFDAYRDAIELIEAIHTAQGTTVPAKASDLQGQLTDVAHKQAVEDSLDTYKADTQFAQALIEIVQDHLIDLVEADQPSAATDFESAWAELVRQMIVAVDSVQENAIGISIGTAPSGTGVPVIDMTIKDGDGSDRQWIYPEDLVGVYESATSVAFVTGPQAELLVQTWPDGSGVSSSISTLTTLLVNSSFDEDDDNATIPDDWDIWVGDAGVDILLTVTEVQTVILSGDPTSGTYILRWTRVDSEVLQTEPIDWDADGDDVEAALSAIEGLDDVEVTTTGTSPNYTHTIAFNAVAPAGDQPLLTSINNLDTGSKAHAEVTAGSAYSKSYRALHLLGDGATLHQLRQLIDGTMLPETNYGISFHCKTDDNLATGTIKVQLIDGQGNVVNDSEGTANSISVDVATLTSSAFANSTGFFRLPAVIPDVLYLQIVATVAISNTHSVFIDDLVLAEAVELYEGGPYAALFAGSSRDVQDGDRWVATATNDQGGKLQTWTQRFGWPSSLPSSGTPTIAD